LLSANLFCRSKAKIFSTATLKSKLSRQTFSLRIAEFEIRVALFRRNQQFIPSEDQALYELLAAFEQSIRCE